VIALSDTKSSGAPKGSRELWINKRCHAPSWRKVGYLRKYRKSGPEEYQCSPSSKNDAHWDRYSRSHKPIQVSAMNLDLLHSEKKLRKGREPDVWRGAKIEQK